MICAFNERAPCCRVLLRQLPSCPPACATPSRLRVRHAARVSIESLPRTVFVGVAGCRHARQRHVNRRECSMLCPSAVCAWCRQARASITNIVERSPYKRACRCMDNYAMSAGEQLLSRPKRMSPCHRRASSARHAVFPAGTHAARQACMVAGSNRYILPPVYKEERRCRPE